MRRHPVLGNTTPRMFSSETKQITVRKGARCICVSKKSSKIYIPGTKYIEKYYFDERWANQSLIKGLDQSSIDSKPVS